MFHFNQLSQSADGNTLSGQWTPTAELPMFAGHFPGLPIMPAVAQLALLQALINQHSGWGTNFTGGSRLKFAARIQPGDTLTVTLQRSAEKVRFSIDNATGLASKGTLTLSDERDD